MIPRNFFSTKMKGRNIHLSKKNKINNNDDLRKEKKSSRIKNFFSPLFKKRYYSKEEVVIIENDTISDISNCTTINPPEECYIKGYNRQFDTTSEATLYSSSNSSAVSSTNDIYYNKFNTSTFPPVSSNLNKNIINVTYTSSNDFKKRNNLKSHDASPPQKPLKSDITRNSFFSSPSISPTQLISLENHIPIKLQERDESTMPILTNIMAEQIRTKIPNLYKEAINWKLLYSIDQHGISLKTLYSNIKDSGPCVMVINTDSNEVFGAYTSEPFDPEISKGFYGSGLSFLWKLKEDGTIDFYQAISSNQYYMLADNHFIAMGGGNGKFGFYLNENLIDGYVSPCMTYDYNSITENENFECFGLEIWGLEF